MASLTLRSNTTGGLTNTQIDNNFTALNTDSLVQVNIATPWKASTAVTKGQVLSVLESAVTAGSAQSVSGGTLIVGKTYVIVSLGTTTFTNWGATNQIVGTVFTATGVGSGTGTVKLVVRFYEVTTSGTTGSTGPNHTGSTVTNGTAGLTFVDNPPVYLLNSKINGVSIDAMGDTDNFSVGFNNLTSATGTMNTALGKLALRDNTTGGNNTAVGNQTLANNEDGIANTAVGLAAMVSNTSGNSNSAFGVDSLHSNINGSSNTAFGRDTLYYNESGTENTAVGTGALRYNIVGSNNIAIGSSAAQSNYSGNENISLGTNSALANSTGNYNIAIGSNALRFSTGNSGPVSTPTTGAISIGGFSSWYLAYGEHNTVLGTEALYATANASYNTIVGYFAAHDHGGANNTAIGYKSLMSATFSSSGSGNTAIGYKALYNAYAYYNTALGENAGLSALSGGSNTFIGNSAGYNNIGSYNTFIGRNSGYNLTGSSNTVVGYFTASANPEGTDITVGNNNIILAGGDGTTSYWSDAYNTTILNTPALKIGNSLGRSKLEMSKDISSWTLVSTSTLPAANPTDVAFSTDGGKYYTITGSTINQYTLVDAFNPASKFTTGTTLSVVTIDTAPTGIAFSIDGTKMFICGSNGVVVTNGSGVAGEDRVYQFTLSTAWDISTATLSASLRFAAGDASLPVGETSPQGIAFNYDGTSMFMVGGTRDTVYRYALTTGWTLSTAIYGGELNVGTAGTVTTLSIGDSTGLGNNAIACTYFDNNQNLTARVIITGTNTGTGIISGYYPGKMYAARINFFSPFNNTGYIKLIDLETGSDVSVTPGTFTGLTFTVTSIPVKYQETNPTSVRVSYDGTKLYVLGVTTDSILEYNINYYNFACSDFSGKTFLGNTEGTPTGFWMWHDYYIQATYHAGGGGGGGGGGYAGGYGGYGGGGYYTYETINNGIKKAYVVGQDIDSIAYYKTDISGLTISPSSLGNSTGGLGYSATLTLKSPVKIVNNLTLEEQLYVNGAVKLDNTLAVTGATTIGGAATVTGNLTVSGGTITTGNVAASLLSGNTTTAIAIGSGLTSGALTIGGGNQTTSTITIGGGTGTGTITLGQSTGAQTINIGTGATLAATTKAINIGTLGVSTSVTNITLGSAVSGATGTTTINGTAINIATSSATAVTTTIGPAVTANIVKIGSTAAGTVSLTTDVTTGTANVFTSLTTGTLNLATGGASTINLGGTTAAVYIGTTTGNSILEVRGSSTTGTATIRTNSGVTNAAVFNTFATTGNLFGAATTVSIGASTGTTTVNNNLTITGDLTVNGTTTTVNASTLAVDDKNIELGSVASGTISTTGTVGSITGTGPWTATITNMTSTTGLVVGSTIAATAGTGTLYGGSPTSVVVASIVSSTSITYTVTGGSIPTAGTVTTITTTGATDVTAQGGGITLKGASDKTISWDSSTAAWVSSESVNLASGKVLKFNGNTILSSTTLDSVQVDGGTY